MLCRKEVTIMGSVRRSSLEVQQDYIKKLTALEKEQARLEKIAADTSKPIHWAAIKAVAIVVAQIASIVRAIKKRRKK